MESREFPRTLAALAAGVAEGVAPGFAVGVWEALAPTEFRFATAGVLRTHPERGQPVALDTVYDLSSLTKVLGTAALVARLVDRGWLRFTDPLRAFLPEFGDGRVTLAHLLAHTSGLPAWAPLWERMRARAGARSLESIPVRLRQRWMRELVLAIGPERELETSAVYSDLSFLLLGFALENLLGQSLDRAIRHHAWEPMGLTAERLFRRVPGRLAVTLDRVAPTENSPWRARVVHGQVHDDNCWTMGGYGGHAGAFGDLAGVLGFARGLFSGFLSAETRAAIWTRVARPAGCSRTLGWDTLSGPTPSASELFSSASVGHLGFTGPSLWIDPPARLAIAVLCNRVHPSRENILHKVFRPGVHRALRLDLGR